jgi:tripartite-type tricarboxylate transporter receptor subunit TctC
MNLPRRRFLYLAGVVATLSSARRATAQAYPTRPLRWVVGFAAGGTTDVMMRIMGRWLSERLGQPVIIENKPGAGTNIAVQSVVSSPPDGYTLLLATATNAINGSLYDALPFNFVRDIAPVSGFFATPLVLVVSPSMPADSLAAFIAYARANPDRVNLGSFGTGTISHLAGELLKSTTGVKMVHVPYRGGAPMIADVLGGQVQAAIDALPNALPHIRRGALRALAVLGSKRSDALPDVPTVGETIAGYDVRPWTGVGVPSGTPGDVIEKINYEINAGLADPGIKAQLADLGAAPIILTPAEFGALIAADVDKWSKVVKLAGLRPE